MSAVANDRLVAAIGLMSGTSMDGIDAALIWTDGVSTVRTGAALTVPYDEALRRRLQKVVADRGAEHKAREKVARDITLAHAEAVSRLLAATGIGAEAIDVIGFHGHTVFHNPAERVTIQIGDAALLAERTDIGVVSQMRLADVRAGGQGAPLVPLYHAARAAKLEKPVAVLNIGGVANVTWLGADERIVAYDCGPGNALIDDFVHAKTGKLYDASGTLSLSGKVDEAILAKLLDNPFFDQPPPKSLDRNAFDASDVIALSAADGEATLASFTVQAAARSLLTLGQSEAAVGLRRGAAQPGDHGRAGGGAAGNGGRAGREGRLARRCAGGRGVRLSGRPLAEGPAAQPALDHRRAAADAGLALHALAPGRPALDLTALSLAAAS